MEEDTVHAGCMERGVGVRSKGDLRLFLYVYKGMQAPGDH